MKIEESPYIPNDAPGMQRKLTYLLRDIASQLNALSEGRLSSRYQATTSAPTAGSYRVGDFVSNSAPSELGTAGSKYIITGWICTSAIPLAFRDARVLTGN